jgi:glycosyltransferase involved in cell wall biosynthesis
VIVATKPKGTPQVSVVMPCLNAARFIERALDSIDEQTIKDYEVLVIDNGSTDDTVDIVERRQSPRIQLLHQPEPGVSHARNKGLANARGPLIAFLDADDTWAPNCLERLLEGFESRPDAVLAYCGWQNIGCSEQRDKPFVPPDYENEEKLSLLLQRCRWPIHATLTRRESIEDAGRFNTALSHAEDFLLWLTIAHDKPIVRVPEVLAYYHFHDAGQASSQSTRAAIQHLEAQSLFLKSHPLVVKALGKNKVAELTYGELLHRGYVLYWKRDLRAARTIFRVVMKTGYGSTKDWKYMLPSMLPESWHQKLIRLIDR